MGVRFFGEFLLAHGEIDEVQLQEALVAAQETNLELGTLAVRAGHLTRSEVDQILVAQQDRDRRFGEIGLELGLLDETQIAELLRAQSETHLYLGEALVQAGHLARNHLQKLLDRYQDDQAPYPQPPPLPKELQGQPLIDNVLGGLARILLRVARLQLKLALPPCGGAGAHPYRATLAVESPTPLRVGIAASQELALAIATAMLGCSAEDLDDSDLPDALGEFLNLFVGFAKTEAEQERGPRLSLGTPEHGTLPETGFRLEVITPGGHGTLVIASG